MNKEFIICYIIGVMAGSIMFMTDDIIGKFLINVVALGCVFAFLIL